jgi:hypothetical protein
MECSDKWNANKGQGSKVIDSWMDINRRTIVNKIQSGDWGKTIDGEGEF